MIASMILLALLCCVCFFCGYKFRESVEMAERLNTALILVRGHFRRITDTRLR